MDPPAALTEREITGYLLKKKQKNSSFISYYVFILSFVPCSWASVGQMIHRAHFWVIFGRFIDLNIAFLSTSFPPRLYFPSLLLFAFQMWTVNSGEVTSGRRGLWYLLPANVNLSQHLWVGIKLRVCVCVFLTTISLVHTSSSGLGCTSLWGSVFSNFVCDMTSVSSAQGSINEQE